MMQQGSSNSFRQRSGTERLAAGVGAWMPDGLRHRLRSLYNLVLARTTGDFVCSLPGGEQVRVLPQHRQITWNPDEYEAFRAAVQPGDVIVDVGANLGAYTLLFGLWTGAAGRVFAFEPAPVPYGGLSAHISLNGLSDRVVALPQAVSCTEGTLDFVADGIDGANRLTAGASRGRASVVPVGVTTLDAISDRYGVTPRVIKIDAEGAELDVLRGARRTIRTAGRGLQLFVEMHPHLWTAFSASREAIEAEIALQGLRAERLDGHPDIWGIEGVCLRLRPCAS
jgi:FkbM family methyltransferase